MSTPHQPHHSASSGAGDPSAAKGESVPLRRPNFNIFSRGDEEHEAHGVAGGQPARPITAAISQKAVPAEQTGPVPHYTVPEVQQSEEVVAPQPVTRPGNPAPQAQAAPVESPFEQVPRPEATGPVLPTTPEVSSPPEALSRVTVSRRPSEFGRENVGGGTDVSWHTIPNCLPYGLVILDSRQNVSFANTAHTEMLGVSVQEVGGVEEWLRILCPNADYAARVLNSWREHIWRKQLTRTFSLKGNDHKLREIEFSAKLMENGGMLLTHTDVTEARRNESQLRMGEKKFRTVFQNDTCGLVLVDRTGGILDANPVFEEFTKSTVHQLQQKTLLECLVPQDGLRLRAAEEKIANRIPGTLDRDTIEVRFRSSDQASPSLPPVKMTLCPIRDDEGGMRLGLYFLEIRASGDDVVPKPDVQPVVENASVQGDVQLQQSREENLALLNVVPDMIFLLDRDLKIVDVAPPSGKWTGRKALPSWSDGEVGKAWPALEKAISKYSTEAFAGSVISDLEFSSDGGYFRVSMAPCGGERLLVVVSDSTEIVKLRNEARWREAAVERVDESILITDLRGTICDANPAVVEEFGYEKDDLIGRGVSRLYSRDKSGANAFNRKLSASLNKTGHWEGRNEFYRKDGSHGVADIKFSPVMDNGKPRELLVVHREVKAQREEQHHSLPAASSGLNFEHEQMQHRFRNQLQMVTSLFALESDGENEKDRLDAGNRWQVRLRVMAQAYAHQHPQDQTVWVVPLIRSISDEVAAVTGRGPGRREVIVHGSDSFRIEADVATAFSLLIGEIIRLGLKRPVRSEGPELFLQLERKSGSELSIAATAGAGGALFPDTSESTLTSMKNLIQQLRGRIQMTQNGGTQALSIIISSGVKLGEEA